MSNKKHTGLTRRTPSLMALEQRFMFDGAAVDTALKSIPDMVPEGDGAAIVQFATNAIINLPSEVSAKLLAAISDADNKILANTKTSNFATVINQAFGRVDGIDSTTLQTLIAEIEAGLNLKLELLPGQNMSGAAAAYYRDSVTGQETIYINADWISNAATDASMVARALLEEYGHALDHKLHPATDSPGDEGAVYANLVLGNNGDLSGLYAENDTVKLTLADGTQISAEATNPLGVVQSFILPMSEQDTYTSLHAISSTVTNQIWSISSITVTQNGTVIVYDNWEDGYEADPNNPTQSSTQIWGDGNLANGVAPGTTNDLLTAGSVITLTNKVDLTKVGLNTGQSSLSINSGYYYDGRDMIHATAPVSVTQAQYADTPGSVLAGAVNVYDVGAVGKNYIIPVGQGTAGIFNYSSLHIVATQDSTTVTIDPDGAGSRTSTTYTLNKGQTLLVGGMGSGVGITAGATVNSDKAIEVYAIDGATSPSYQNRWYALSAVDQWGSSYYAPVYTTNSSAPSTVYLYNAGTSPIDVYYDTTSVIGAHVTINAGASTTVAVPTTASGTHFYTLTGAAFFALGINDSGSTWDWSYSLVPEKYLTSKFVLGWAPGNANAPASNGSVSGTNGSPAWVTATADTRIYIDYSGDGGLSTAPNGANYDAYYDIKALETYRIFAPNGNQTGLTVFTTDGTLLAGAWGEDASKAGAGTPYLDMGYTALPYPDYVVSKSAEEAAVSTGNNGDGWIQLGEQVEYSISLINRSVVDVYNINIKDVLGSSLVGTYVAGSGQLQVIAPDGTALYSTNSTSTPALDNIFTSSGYTLADVNPNTAGIQGLQRGYEVLVTYRTQLPTFNSGSLYNTLANAGFKLTNDAIVTGTTLSGSPVLDRTVTNTTQVSVLTTDGTVAFYNDATYSSAASSVAEAGTLYIQVTDNDANTNTGSVDTITVNVTNTTTGEVEAVALTETGANTGVFRGSLLTTITSSDQSVANKLYALREQGIKVDYTDPVYGTSFDNPLTPAVPGVGTSLANTASLSVATPSQTKILYLSSDSPNNLDRIDPVATSDTTTALTTALVNAASVSISDNFNSGNYTGGSGWSTGGWLETDSSSSNSPATTKGNIRITSSMLEIRGGGS